MSMWHIKIVKKVTQSPPYAALRQDQLLSTAKTSKLYLLVKSPFWWRSGRCRQCCSDFCFSVPAISKWTLDWSRHQQPLTVYDWCNGTRTESAEKSLYCWHSSTGTMSILSLSKKPSWPTRLSRWKRQNGQLCDLTATRTKAATC